MDDARAHVIFTGRVQGVYFRAFAERAARTYGLTGWVRNTLEGHVEAVFEGDRMKVEQTIGYCRTENPAAMVDNVEVQWSEPTGKFDDFIIRYY